MPLPDPHAGEPTAEIDPDTWTLLGQAKDSVDAWQKEFNRLKAKLIEELGDAYAATINGVKVASYRPQTRYAEARIIKDYPDLSVHFFRSQTENVFDMARFAEQHPDIAQRYRVRSFNILDVE